MNTPFVRWGSRRLASLSLVVVASCVAPSPPPSVSFTRYAKSVQGRSAASTGRVSFSTSAAIARDVDGEGDSLLALPVVEGGITDRVGDSYRWSVVASQWKLSYDGNLLLADTGGFALGVIHGIGAGILSAGDSGQLFLDLTGGIHAQLPGKKTVPFFGAKVTRTTTMIGDDDFESTWWYGAGLGAQILSGGLHWTPELVVALMQVDGADDPVLFVVPTVTIAAGF